MMMIIILMISVTISFNYYVRALNRRLKFTNMSVYCYFSHGLCHISKRVINIITQNVNVANRPTVDVNVTDSNSDSLTIEFFSISKLVK
jgi:hypothetical protein